ncbi:MAG TPA: alpha/beta hydrolase [Aquabacterium sp.]|nr:alpha/beta hydrolase [Aquabacterium sp.]
MNSGLAHLEVPDAAGAGLIRALVQYPTEVSARGVQIGSYQFDATLDAPVAKGRFPVCLISHGGGGSHLLYRSITTHLSEQGFITVSVEHPGDNRRDRSLMHTDQAAIERPRHVSRVIDALLNDPRFERAAIPQGMSIVGHSMGGYTALALLGGQPWSRTGQSLPVSADPRIACGVLLAPATDWYRAPHALEQVRAPLLVMVGGQDTLTPPEAIRAALAGLPASTSLTWHLVERAGHFAFLTPFPAAMVSPDFPPSQDPDGFDRVRFHQELPQLILDFLFRHRA